MLINTCAEAFLWALRLGDLQVPKKEKQYRSGETPTTDNAIDIYNAGIVAGIPQERLVLAKKRIRSALRKHVVATERTLEQKISDAGPTNQRIDPHVLTVARKEMIRVGEVLGIMSTGTRMILNGILLNRFPNVVRERMSQLRSGIHKLRIGAVPSAQLGKYCQSVVGSINQMAMIVPRQGRRLALDYEIALETFSVHNRRHRTNDDQLSLPLTITCQ